MQAIILAAGMGRRLGEFTADNTKCMLEVNGVRLIDRVLNQLKEHNLDRIVIVTGYEGQKLRRYLEDKYHGWPLVFVNNPVYEKTNNIYSLWLARGYLAETDTLLLESDLIFDNSIINEAIHTPLSNVALVAKYQTWMDGTMVTINEDHNIVNFIPKKDFRYADIDAYYKTVNIYKFSKEFCVDHYLPFLEAYIKVLGENEYYEQVLRVITIIDKSNIKALVVNAPWYEIDDVQDLRIAEIMFAKPKERLKKMQNSFGGYWRYPGMLDYCYLVNPYFPQQRMIDEMKANFEPLLRDYPSGMGVNSLLAGKYFGIKQDYVVVGNGAAELIKSLMEGVEGKVGVIYPTFEEYPNRIPSERLVKFHPDNADFSYTSKDLMAFYADKDISTLLVVNPDNPSGNLIKPTEVLGLADWCHAKGIRLIIDESFVDFAEGSTKDNSLLKNEILEAYSGMCVMKSISKSYGVPGLRLGVLASGDRDLIARIKKDVSIWNINSFAEFYMQIYGKYESDYERSCEKFKKERDLFSAELSTVPYLRVIPSQANYFLCEVLSPYTSYGLTLKLLSDHNILIKDCGHKKGFDNGRQYIRLAIRDRADNAKLVSALNTGQ